MLVGVPRRADLACVARRVGGASLLLLGWVLWGGSDFRGCGAGERPPTGGTLPTTSEGCLVDTDCVSSDACVAVACVRRECVEGGPAVDADADGYAPPPCGLDCDDRDPAVFPDATELCDGVDQDCDDRLDEGATGTRVFELAQQMSSSRLVADGEGLVRFGFDRTGVGSRLLAQRIRADGAADPPVEVAAGLPGSATRLRVSASVDGWAVVYLVVDAPPQRLTVGSDLSLAAAPTDVGDEPATAAEILVHSGSEHVVVDLGPSPRRRVLHRTGRAPRELVASVSPPALASDGPLVAVAEGAGIVRFFDPVSGDDAGSQSLLGPLGARGLASGAGFVYAVFEDGFDYSLAQVRPSSVGPPVGAPGGGGDDRISLYPAAPNLAVVRSGSTGVRLSLLDEGLESYVASFDPSDLGTLVAADEVSVATTSTARTVALADYVDRDVVVLLECGPP